MKKIPIHAGRNSWAAFVGYGCLTVIMAQAVRADQVSSDAQDTVTVRGEVRNVWPLEDLRDRGFEIRDVPREDNAYWVYLDAINAFEEMPFEVQDPFDYAMRTAWPEGHEAKLKAYLSDKPSRKAIELARKASAFDEHQICYYGDPDGSIISVLLPDLSSYRALGKLLVADGRRLEAEGDLAGALESYIAAMRMAHHVSSGFTLIENLVGVSVWALADNAISQTVLRRDLSVEQLETILDRLNELRELQPSALSGMKNERIFGNCIVDELTVRPFHVLQNIHGLTGSGGLFDVGSPGAIRERGGWHGLEARFGQLVIPDRTVKKHMNAYYDKLIDRASMPAYEANWNDNSDQEYIEAIPKWDILSRVLLPSLSRAGILGERCRMQTEATRITAALRIYALQHDGDAPSKLSELTDWIDAKDLIDPFSGSEYVYDHRDGVWRFYSVSENFVDDGGKVSDDGAFKLDYVVRFPPAAIKPYEPIESGSAEL